MRRNERTVPKRSLQQRRRARRVMTAWAKEMKAEGKARAASLLPNLPEAA